MNLFEEYGKAVFQQEVLNAQIRTKIIELKKLIVEEINKKKDTDGDKEHKTEE